jgi:membrane protease YdiL (CAAX protease family)
MLTSALAAESESPVATMFVGNGAQIVGLGACCVIAARRFDGGIPRFLFGPFKSRPHATTLMTIIVILLALGICPLIRDATVALIHNVAPSHDFKPHTTLKALHEPGQPIAVVAALWVGAVVIAPLAEESFFRGLLQTFLSNIIPNRWPAIALTSVAFGLIHFPQPHAIGALIVLGLLIGYAYERTGSLLVAAFIHAVFNLKTLVWVTLGSSTV